MADFMRTEYNNSRALFIINPNKISQIIIYATAFVVNTNPSADMTVANSNCLFPIS
jgi:hypothetical protein